MNMTKVKAGTSCFVALRCPSATRASKGEMLGTSSFEARPDQAGLAPQDDE